MHGQLPNFFLMGVFYLLNELRLVHVIQHQIPLFGAHHQIFVTGQNEQTENIHLLNVLFENYLKGLLISVELYLPNVDGIEAISHHEVIIVGNHHTSYRALVAS